MKKLRVFEMLYVKQKLIENMRARHSESLFNYKEVKDIIKKLGSYILPTVENAELGNERHLHLK